MREISGSLIRRWYYAHASRGQRPRTLRGALHALRALFRYLTDQGAIPADPALEVRLPKRDAAVRLLVTDDVLEALLDTAQSQGLDARSASG